MKNQRFQSSHNKHQGRFQRRRRRGGDGFNFREAAVVINPSLLGKLPPKQDRDEPAMFKLDEDQEAQLRPR